MPEICPKCGTVNQAGRSTCVACGAELEIALFAEMFAPPARIKGRYVVGRPLKQGARLSIYRATDATEGGRPCWVYQLTPTDLAVDARELLEHRFLRRAAVWQTLSHPNILRILDAAVVHHRLYLVTEPVKGISLRSIIQDRQRTVPEQTLLHWAGQLCDALEYLHSQEPPIILGCLSPAAIHVDQAGHVQIVEVGLIRYDRSGLLGAARGIVGYAAPEQRRGELSPRSDIYSLGIILYQLITRFDPRERPLPSLRKYASGFSEAVLDAIARAYRRDPHKRYGSAAEMRRALISRAALSSPFVKLSPFTLCEGQVADSLPDLVELCVANWEEGMQALADGRIGAWLAQAVESLRAEGRDEEAEQLDRIARRTTQARDQIIAAARPGLSERSREIARNTAFDAWLQDAGATGILPILEVHPSRFDFGVVGANVKARSTLRIRNRGQGYLSGRVESALPWLAVPEPTFGCRAGETVEVRVEARGRALPAGESASPQALHVISNGGETWIGALAVSSPPVLSVEPRTLDYGAITRGASRVAHLNVANKGGGVLSGRVVTRAPWLRVRHPNFRCPAGASAQIAVELLSERLPKGAVRIRRALAVDSDSGQVQIDVAWQWARPALELDTTGIDLGSVERGVRVERTFTIANGGTADLVGRVVARVPWLSVTPAEFRCPPGASRSLTVVCDTAGLPGGSTVEEAALVIEANAGTQTLSASIEVLAPRLVVSTPTIDLGRVEDGEQVEETVMVGNRGSMPWRGRAVVSVPWLSVEPEELECAPGHFMPLTLLLHTARLPHGGEWTIDDAIKIVGDGERQTVGVRVELSRPALCVERRSLDFGLIGRTDIVSLPLEIANVGTGELHWEVQVRGTWIEVVPNTGVCAPGESQKVQVNAYALAVDGESDQAWLTVRSNGGRVDLPASVALSSPLLDAEPLSLDIESENYAPAEQTLLIFNRGVGELKGQVISQVPWLSCEPASFTCATGLSVAVQVRASPEGLREGVHQVLDGLIIESNGGRQEVGVRLTLTLVPRLHLTPRSLQFDDGEVQHLYLENKGYGALRVEVVPQVEWIAVNRREWTIKAGKRACVEVRLVDAPPDAQGNIQIRAFDEVLSLPVKRG